MARYLALSRRTHSIHQSAPAAATAWMWSRSAGFDVSTETVDVSSRESIHALVETATTFGDVTGVIHATGRPPDWWRR